jgi:hypothetical protein
MFEALLYVVEWIASGIYNFVVELWSWFTIVVTSFIISMTIFFGNLAWDIASAIITNLGIDTAINSAWASLDSDIAGLLAAIKFPEAVMNLVTALITRWTMKFVPFV